MSTNSYNGWFTRCEGTWVSHRRYLYGPQKTLDNLVTEFTIEARGENEWAVLWASERNEGEMGLILDGASVKRSRNYFGDGEGTVTCLERIDEDTVVFHSTYGGASYREEIRFLGDNYRLRQTVGYKEGTDKVVVVGQYWEERK